MASLPIQVLFGVYLGVLTGIVPAAIAWTLGFGFKYLTGVTVPGFAVVVLGVAIAGINGGMLALVDPTITNSPDSVALTVALLVVLMLTFYAHAKGDAMGAAFPRRLSLKGLRERTLSSDVVERVGGRGQVRITVAGQVGDMEGYPPLPADLRAEISDGEWTFPADLPLAGLETRLADTLRTEYDLAEVSVRIDDQGRASVDAAPPASGVSKRVPPGKRAVSVDTLLPTGIARGDLVTLSVEGDVIEGTVVSARSYADAAPTTATDGGTQGAADESGEPVQPRAPTTDGGEGRMIVAVDRGDAVRLLRAERARIHVRSRGHRREFELLSLLRRAGKRVTRVSVGEDSEFAGSTLGDAKFREAHGVVVLAVRSAGSWTVAPGGTARIDAGDELFAVGTRDAIERFAGAIAP
ncbi:MAG: potassium channel family protein [Halobacteriales archaeon]